MISTTPFLRLILRLDAIASGGMAVLLAIASGWLAGLLQLPQQLLFVAGVFLIGYAAFVGWISSLRTRAEQPADAGDCRQRALGAWQPGAAVQRPDRAERSRHGLRRRSGRAGRHLRRVAVHRTAPAPARRLPERR